MARGSLSYLLMLALLTFAGANRAEASFHLWVLTEAYANADGSIQFVELSNSFNSEQFLSGQTLRATQGASTRNFVFPANSPAPTAGHRLLLATQAFADLPGAPTPDFIIPDNFLFAPNGRIEIIGGFGNNYTNLPTDGANSLNFPGPTVAANTPTNYAGDGGAVDPGAIANPLPPIPKGDVAIELTTVAGGLVSPLGVAAPDDGSGRLLIHDQVGRIVVVKNGAALPTPMLDVSGRLVALNGGYDERGLLGVATHPDFTANPRIYTYTSEPVAGAADFTNTAASQNHQSVVAEWTLTGADAASDTVDTATRREILRIDQPQSNHNGGALHFGPDGNLFISLGDGGQSDDQGDGHVPGGNAQDTSNIYGTLLRIDVDRTAGTPSANGQYNIPADNPFVGSAGLDEIFVHGLRNPYAFSFDFHNFTTDSYSIYIGDAGQNAIEEVTRVTPGLAGANLGWPYKEGSFFFDNNGNDPGFVTLVPPQPIPPGLVDPLAEYDHGDGSVTDNGVVVVGGFLYDTPAIPELEHHYVFGDFGVSFDAPSGRLWYLDDAEEIRELIIGSDDRPLGLWLKGFGQDRDGEVYVCGSQNLGPSGTTGVVLKIAPIPSANAAGEWHWYR